jgi:hypothetical protein
MIQGSDPELKDEAVIVGAHLDHFGLTGDRRIFNGADDNASGAAAVLEMAQAFALWNVKPRRMLIFAHWTGEQRGLLGSRYFAEFLTVPLKKNRRLSESGYGRSRVHARKQGQLGDTVSKIENIELKIINCKASEYSKKRIFEY